MEGYGELPEEMRPQRNQKPLVVTQVTEPIEEVRILYINLLRSAVLKEFSEDSIRLFVKDLVDITRTLLMDPCAEIALEACVFTQQLAEKFTELFTYFSPMLARGCFNSLAHRKNKLRAEAIKTLKSLFLCSPSKKNVEVMEDLIGFSDPNVVPIKDFYEPSSKINYLAKMVQDTSLSVREATYNFFTFLLIETTDRYDHQSRITPYLISGLFDEVESLAKKVFLNIEKIGEQYEKDNEKELREIKQFGVDSKWTDVCDQEGYEFPLTQRPRLGAKLLVRKYGRRFVKNLCKDLDNINDGFNLISHKNTECKIIAVYDNLPRGRYFRISCSLLKRTASFQTYL